MTVKINKENMMGAIIDKAMVEYYTKESSIECPYEKSTPEHDLWQLIIQMCEFDNSVIPNNEENRLFSKNREVENKFKKDRINSLNNELTM